MKNAFYLFMISGILLGLATIMSCDKTCSKGYEGSNCRTMWNEKFTGTYSFQDQCSIAGSFSGVATIAPSSENDFTVLLTNFDETGSSATINGTLQDAETIYISSATAGGYTITNATGHYSNGVITWSSFNVAGGGSVDSCSSVWTKQ